MHQITEEHPPITAFPELQEVQVIEFVQRAQLVIKSPHDMQYVPASLLIGIYPIKQVSQTFYTKHITQFAINTEQI